MAFPSIVVVMEKKPPLNNQKRNLLLGLMVVVAALLFLDPFQFLTPKPTPAHRAFSEEELGSALAGFTQSARPAAAQVLDLTTDKQVVLIGIHLLVKEHLDFAASLIKDLPPQGVRLVGVEFLLAADQEAMDRLVSAPAWDEKLARSLFFNWQPLCGYQENINILKAAWTANRGLPAGAAPLRIIGLNVDQDLSAIKSQDDFSKPEILAKVFAKGVPDAAMAKRVLELTAKGEKMVVLCQTQSALTNWEERMFTADMLKRGFADQRRMGNLVYSSLGDKSATVLLSGPWPSRQSKLGSAYPADGQVDQLIGRVADPASLKFPVAWDLSQAVLGQSICKENDFAAQTGEKGSDGKAAIQLIPKLKDLGSVLVAFGQVKDLHAVSAIPDFIGDDLLAAAIKKLPALGNTAKITVAQLNESIQKVQADMQTQLGNFR